MSDADNTKLAIIWYSYTGGSKALAKAAYDAAREAQPGDDVEWIDARGGDADDMLGADGYLFVFPENLAAIAGEMKAFFDRCYYPCLGRIEGRPYAMLVCAGSDGSNAVQQAERIATGWRLKKIADSHIICTHAQTQEQILAPKKLAETELAKAREIGATLATGMAMGVF